MKMQTEDRHPLRTQKGQMEVYLIKARVLMRPFFIHNTNILNSLEITVYL